MNQTNPFDAVALSILRDLKVKNAGLASNQVDNLLHEMLDDTQKQAKSSKASKNPVFSEMESELNRLMREFESRKMDMNNFQMKVLNWESRVRNSVLRHREKEVLMASGSIARNFSSFWS